MERCYRRCGFQNDIVSSTNGTREGLCLAWKVRTFIQLRSCLKNHVDVTIKDGDDSPKWRMTGFYRALDLR